MNTRVERALTPRDSKVRLPSVSGYLEVTADMASDWLTSRNLPTNRPLSRHITGKYQEDIEHDRWLQSPVPVIFDTEGFLIDGQHRLKALANSGKSLVLWISVDSSRAIFGVLDSGYKRNAAHMMPGVKYPSAAAMAARFLAALSDNDRWGIPRYGRITTPEILSVVDQWPELTWYGTEVGNAHRNGRIPQGPHTAVLAQAARTEHIGKIHAWLTALETGENLTSGDARLTLRNRYVTNYQPMTKMPRREIDYVQIVKAWNAYVTGRPMGMLRVQAGEVMPSVEGFDWSHPAERA